jgi:hypothetical protein
MLLKQVQHVQHPPIYFCNIHKKQLQHTFETTKTPKTYICIIRDEKLGPVDSNRRGQSRRRTSTTAISATSTELDSVAMVGDGRRGAPLPPSEGSSVVGVREGAARGGEGAGEPPIPVTPPRHLHGSRPRWGRGPTDLHVLFFKTSGACGTASTSVLEKKEKFKEKFTLQILCSFHVLYSY